MWAVFWLLMLIFAFYLAAVGIAVGPDVIGLAFAIMLICNIIGGWNTDVADPGYMAFSCTAMYHAASLLRKVIFGSNSSRVGLNVGVMIMW